MIKAKDLKIGDKIKITDLCQFSCVHPSTQEVFKILIKRGRPLRIAGISTNGFPYYNCKIKDGNGITEYHTLSVFDEDKNWKKI